MARIAEQDAVAAEEAEVDAPRIDADAGKVAMLRRRLAKRRDDLLVKPEDVPVQRVERGDAAVREAMDIVELQSPTVEGADEPPTALGAEVDGEDFLRGGHGRGPKEIKNSS